jgi:hypothetical protein
VRANFPSTSSKEFWAAELWLSENPSSSELSSLIEGAAVNLAIDSSFSTLV